MTPGKVLLDALPADAGWPPLSADGFAIPMQTRAWVQARLRLLAQPSAMRLIAVRTGEAVDAIAPLFRHGRWLRELPLVFEPSDLVWSTPESLRRLAAALAAQPLPLYLERVPADSPTIAAVRRAYALRGVVRLRPAMPTPFVELGEAARDIDACLDAGRRSDLRRAERRAKALGAVAYELHSPAGEDELAPLLDEAYAVEARSWKAAAGTALTEDRAQGDFIASFARGASRDGVLRIGLMRIDGRAVAMQIAVQWRRRFWLLKSSYDQSCSRCSPGQLLMLHTLRHAIGERLLSYEFMGVMDDWTRLWTRQTREYVQLRAYPFSAQTAALLVGRGVRPVLERARRILR
jgi:CelD/BcsL family acetyltransferase involved in cellulose biosynthesis